MISQEIIEREKKYMMQTYSRLPLNLVRGEGNYVWDDEGKKYLDFVSGLGAINLGHCHLKVVEAIEGQSRKLIHVSNLFYTEPQIELAERICSLSFGDRCFFANSGAEANEAAIKLARKYGRMKRATVADTSSGGLYPYEVITTLKGFHGRTLATLAATGQPEKQKYFLPMPEGFKHVLFNDLKAMNEAISEKTCAIMVEAIQGEGGVYAADDEYLAGIRALCDRNDLLLILDEVQTGLGRTGKLFAYQHYGIEPDIMTLAKGLGSGFPIGAMVGSRKVSSIFEPGDHATTFGGAPLASAVGLATLRVLEEEKLVENCAQVGFYLQEKLAELSAARDMISEIRGKGLMVGVELKQAVARKVVEVCLGKGLIINNIGDYTLRFLPPLIIGKRDVDRALQILKQVLSELPEVV